MPLRAHYKRAYAGVRRAGYGPAGKPGNDEAEGMGLRNDECGMMNDEWDRVGGVAVLKASVNVFSVTYSQNHDIVALKIEDNPIISDSESVCSKGCVCKGLRIPKGVFPVAGQGLVLFVF